MNTEEFSNTFDTMLASYNNQAVFGEQSSRADIVLDEYEKSVLLTQAQDIVVKSYFDARLNHEGAGMDDTTKRQLDFSSLITVRELERAQEESTLYDDRGIIYKMPYKTGTTVIDPLFILNEKIQATQTHYNKPFNNIVYGGWEAGEDMVVGHLKGTNLSDLTISVIFEAKRITDPKNDGMVVRTTSLSRMDNSYTIKYIYRYIPKTDASGKDIAVLKYSDVYQDDYVDLTLDVHCSFEVPGTETTVMDETILPSAAKTQVETYTVVPISYKEYDRMMSKPYSQPLKKQAWRLFQNNVTGFDSQFELIPKFNVIKEDAHNGATSIVYKVRYIRRPNPIVLEDLPEGLSIDGITQETQCELNPVIHIDILNKAVELALSTRGGRAVAPAQPQQQSRQGQ